MGNVLPASIRHARRKTTDQSPSAGQGYASYGWRPVLVHGKRSIGEPGQEVVKDW